MSLLWPLPDYADGDFTKVQPVGLAVFSSPLPNTTIPQTFKQPFVQYLKDVVALALNTPYAGSGAGCVCAAGLTPELSSYFLIAEGPKHDVGGGIVRWDRTYSAVPATWYDWETMAYSFVGSAPDGALTNGAVGRMRVTQPA